MADEQLMPRQHVWGVDSLAEDGHSVSIAPYEEPAERGMLAKMSKKSRYVLGQLDQELFAIRQSADLYYSADQGSARGLALLQAKPVISVVHHKSDAGALGLTTTRRHAGLVCLSEHVRSMLPTEVRRRSIVAPWGPDLGSGLYVSVDESGGILSAGKSNRDLPTLVAALARSGDGARVYDPFRRITSPPKNVTIVQPGHSEEDPAAPGVYLARKVISDIARASVVAIPVLDPDRLTGLTEINDALALGKPMVVTRSPYLPIDIEASNCGIFVDPGDVDGWVRALQQLQDADVRREMGLNARKFAEQSWNYSLWNDTLRNFVNSV